MTTPPRISHDPQQGSIDMDEQQRLEYLRIAYRAADDEWRPVNEATDGASPEEMEAAYQRARAAALAALTGAGLDGEDALALAERAARQQDDEGEVPVHYEEGEASRYPAYVGFMSPDLLADGYTITWAPGYCLTLERRGPRGERAAYRGEGPTMQRAWDEVRAQLGHREPKAASTTASSSRKAPGTPGGSAVLYRVVQYYDEWPFDHDHRIPHGSKSHRRTDTFRTLAPVQRRMARANGQARSQLRDGGDWAAFVAVAEQLTDDGWQPIEVDFPGIE